MTTNIKYSVDKPLRLPWGSRYYRAVATQTLKDNSIFSKIERKYILKGLCNKTVAGLAMFIRVKDPVTYRHSQRVTSLASMIARDIRLSPEEVQNIEYAGILHDIGKIYMPNSILKSTKPLTHYQRRIIQEHPLIGTDIIKHIHFLKESAGLILHHHERYDGTGYPYQLQEEQIPLGARILAIADAYEAMTSPRPYRKKPLSQKEALAEVENNKGNQFDPQLVPVFNRIVKL